MRVRRKNSVNTKVFAVMLVAGMAAGGAADQLNLYLNPVMLGAAFDAAANGAAPASEAASTRSASLDQPTRR